MKFLKEVKDILKLLDNQFGFKKELDYVFLMNKRNRVYLVNKDIERIK